MKAFGPGEQQDALNITSSSLEGCIMRSKLPVNVILPGGPKAFDRAMTFSFKAPKDDWNGGPIGWDYTRAWLVDSRLENEGVYFVPHQKVTILLPGQMVLDVAESINIINTGLQTRFLGEGIMVNKVGLVVGCYRFIDNHDNATVTRMVCFHDALTTPEGTRVTQQQLEEFGTRWIPGTFSDKDRRADGQSELAPAVEQPTTPRQALKFKARFGPTVIISQNNAVDKGSGANWATGAGAVEGSRSATPASDDEIPSLGELDTPSLTETPGLALHVGTQSDIQSNRKTSS